MGARSGRMATELEDLLRRFRWLPFRPAADFRSGAEIYRACRGAGVTPGGLVDCSIAAVAIRTGATLLTADAAQARIADVVDLRLDPASPTT